jgi:tRNA-2-methylthio-N6-dimethylallyladenosine synthase
MNKVFIKTYGCQMNEYDSAKMLDILADNYQLTSHPQDADIILFNTCSIREKAEEKVFSDLGRIKHLKQNNPNLIIGVGGCVASQEGEAIVKRAKYVDIVFGPQTLHRLPQLIANSKLTHQPQVDISFPEIEKFDNLPKAKVEGVSAYVSIMEGCSKYCSYCVVPYTRGEEISRPLDSIMAEIKHLVAIGVKEVNLLGQNVNAYCGLMADGEKADFALLLQLIHQIPQILRIRYTTSHPNEMTSRIINCYATLPKLVSHLHLPVQSGSDRILAKMKRGYTILEYKAIINAIRKLRPQISFSSDFIIGFPGETEEDFNKTLSLVDQIKYDSSFSFIYSPRPGTPASNIPDDVSHEVKLARLQLLQHRLNQYSLAISNNMIGKVEEVLVESLAKKNNHELSGRTNNFKVVNFAGNTNLIGTIVKVQITHALHNTLRGTLILS